MSDRVRRVLPILVILAVALIVWLPTIGWGLPSRDADKYLFGDRRPWTGKEILALTSTTQPATMRGADVDADPIVDRSKPVILNDTDAKRAAIVRRYRLMSGQPDEFIQFKALSEMAGRSGWAKLDPRLYQYGGLWMYPAGAMVRAAMLIGIIESPPPGVPALEFYLDRPDAFGRFYVVARFYSWCWGVVAALAIVWIARRITASRGLATLAAIAFMVTPVVRTATHEAKPHLAGAALCLCAVIAATRYVETGRRRWAIASGTLCGAAMAMVVSMLLSVVVLPTMCWLRYRAERRLPLPRAGGEGGGKGDETQSSPDVSDISWHGRPGRDDSESAHPARQHGRDARATKPATLCAVLFASLAVAAIVYVATNPFVLINAIAHPQILRSNLGNSTAMYSPRSDGLQAVADALRIADAGATGTLMLFGTIGFAIGVIRRRSLPLMLLASVAAVIAAQFVALAAAKPAEYARFALVPAAAAAIGLVALIPTDPRRFATKAIVAVIGLAACAEFAWTIATYPKNGPRRARAMTMIDRRVIASGHPLTLGVYREPAPWSAPPMNLFDATWVLMPRDPSRGVDRLIWPANLGRQLGRAVELESVDWRENVLVVDDVEAATRPSHP